MLLDLYTIDLLMTPITDFDFDFKDLGISVVDFNFGHGICTGKGYGL